MYTCFPNLARSAHTMVALDSAAVVFLIVGRVVGQFPATGDGNTPFPEPLIFYNLTMEEFHAKRWDYRQHTIRTRDPEHLSKRVPFRQESKNNADQQAVVELRTETCVEKFGEGFRATSGTCRPTKNVRFMEWSCQRLVMTGLAKKTGKTCEKGYKCAVMEIFNFYGRRVQLPHCVQVLPIDRKENDVDIVPVYEGHTVIPDNPADPWSPGSWSPGTWDTFWHLSGEFSGLTGNYEYRGHHASGKGFRSQSPKQVSSWCCMGCPSGTLYVSTVGFKSEALGFTVDASIL